MPSPDALATARPQRIPISGSAIVSTTPPTVVHVAKSGETRLVQAGHATSARSVPISSSRTCGATPIGQPRPTSPSASLPSTVTT